jgi:hypothetical protein
MENPLEETKQKKTWFKIVSNKYLLISLLFAVWMLFLDNYSYMDQRQLNKQIDELQDNKKYYQEEIKKDKAKPVKNSGRGFRKGDAEFHEFLLDYKHNGASFTLTRLAWMKMRKDAWKSNHKYPCISVVLGEDSDVKVAIIEWHVFKELIKDSDYE